MSGHIRRVAKAVRQAEFDRDMTATTVDSEL
jgi:hypothetical protein